MQPVKGDIVLFSFGDHLPDSALHSNSEYGKTRTVPAIVVEVVEQSGAPDRVNLQVFIDGRGNGGVRWEPDVPHESEIATGLEDRWDWRNVT